MALDSSSVAPSAKCLHCLLPALGAEQRKHILTLLPWSHQSLSVTFAVLLSVSLSPPSCCEGHQSSGDAVPQEGGELESPSLQLFFHKLLFMSDRPPPDKWLPYGKRKAQEREGRKNAPLILALPEAF